MHYNGDIAKEALLHDGACKIKKLNENLLDLFNTVLTREAFEVCMRFQVKPFNIFIRERPGHGKR